MDELKHKIVTLCNESGLSLEAMIYVLKDVWRDAEDTLRQLKLQAQQKQEQQKEEETE